MSFANELLSQPRPDTVRSVKLPRRIQSHPSPADWRDEVIYFFLPDRFSDGREAGRPLLDPTNAAAFRPPGFRFDRWSSSGSGRYQGGNLQGARSKLAYIASLGATTVWVGPIFKQRTHWDSYHGYAIQDFLEVDPRLGNRQDLVDFVSAAHSIGLRVLLDVVFNHTSQNWLYDAVPSDQPPYKPWPDFYARGPWLDGRGNPTVKIGRPDDGVHPQELQPADYYTRAGEGNLGAGDINDPHSEFRRTDFAGDRDINYDKPGVLDDVARCYKYWIALTDCDGFRIDTLKHLDQESGRNLCGTIKEFAAGIGKTDFFLVGEVAGSDYDADLYLEILGSNLNATLDIGEIRPTLAAVAKGLQPPLNYFSLTAAWDDDLGSHRNSGKRRVSILDDHDHVSGDKVRFSSDAASSHQVVAGIAILLFGLGIPCIYYGTEQAFAGPERSAREQFLPDYNVGNPPPDKYLREAMFGPEHPRLSGLDGLAAGPAGFDPNLPGFGPFGTSGAHCFNPNSDAFIRIAALIVVRQKYPSLRYGRQYQRPTRNFGAQFALPQQGELLAWSRILDDEETLCIVNGHGTEDRGADVVVDASLNASSSAGDPWSGTAPYFVVAANSAQTAAGAAYVGSHPVGSRVAVSTQNGTTFLALRDVGPSEVLVLLNRPQVTKNAATISAADATPPDENEDLISTMGWQNPSHLHQPKVHGSDHDFGLRPPQFAEESRRLVVAVTNDTSGNEFLKSLRSEEAQARLGFRFAGTLGEMLRRAGVEQARLADEMVDKFAFLDIRQGYELPVANGILRHGCGIASGTMTNVDVETDFPMNFSAQQGFGPNYVLRSAGSLHDKYLGQLNIPSHRSASGIRIAVVDSGYEKTGILSGFLDLVEPKNKAEKDNFGHGTAMAAIISDVARGADVFCVRAADRGIHVSDAMLGVSAASFHFHAHIVNLSFGLPLTQSCSVCGASSGVSKVFHRLLRGLSEKQISTVGPPILVAATGNNGCSTGFDAPAAWDFAVAVGSINHNVNRSSFSNYGTSGHSQYIMMPGGEENQGTVTEWIGEAAHKCYGTSVAAAYASGVFALYMANRPYAKLSRTALLSQVLAKCQPCSKQDPREHGLGYLPYK
jgi:glycosidase